MSVSRAVAEPSASPITPPEPAVPLLRAFDGEMPPPDVLAAIRDGEAAGVALYRGLNVRSPAQLRALGDAVQAAARTGGRPTAIVATDQEGGQLMGIGEPATQFAGNLALGAVGDADLARRVGAAIGAELAAMGIVVDWAPDLDLATIPESPAVGGRAFGDDPPVAGTLGEALIRGLQGEGVAAAIKHFPGSGETLADPHHGLPVVDVDAATLGTRELAPFRMAMAARPWLLMVSHAAYPALEPDGGVRPALRSRAILHSLLRERMGFEGVVVTDALDMGAVDQADVASAALQAVTSGVDLLLAGPGQADRPEELAALVSGLRALPVARDAAARVERLRRWLSDQPQPSLDVVGCPAHRALAAELAERSITLLRDRSGTLPIGAVEPGRLLVVTPTPADLTPADTSSTVTIRLADALARRWPGTRGLVTAMDPGADDIRSVVAAAADADQVILGTIDAFRHEGQRALARALVAAGSRVILVAMRMPTDAGAIPEVDTAIACWSIHDASTEAAAAVLCGERPATGRMPLTLSTGETP
ncbi:MAG: glycoside hydrolase family 3 protein [Chloroflexi bacterium]|nr:glycoside hydrolase family 3 protein [Chloroflexota bacterium]